MLQLVNESERFRLTWQACANGDTRTLFINQVYRLDLATLKGPLIDADAFIAVDRSDNVQVNLACLDAVPDALFARQTFHLCVVVGVI